MLRKIGAVIAGFIIASVVMMIFEFTNSKIFRFPSNLDRSDLNAVVTAIRLSRATFRKIKQNLFWAFFYNVLAIPLAMLGLLHPVIAEIAMASSSITVVSNANLLRRAKVKFEDK